MVTSGDDLVEDGSHGYGASPSSTGQRLPGASFPYAHAQVLGVNDIDKLRIDAGRK